MSAKLPANPTPRPPATATAKVKRARAASSSPKERALSLPATDGADRAAVSKVAHAASVPAPSGRNTGSSGQRALALLAVLAREGRAVSLADLSSHLGLPKATTHRLCAMLIEAGMVMRDTDPRDLAIGPALRQLALDVLNNGSVRGLRHQVLADLVAQVGETCNFTTLDGASVLYLDRVEAPWPWRLTLDVGVHVPLHCTASGKLMLALMPADVRDATIAGIALTRMTDNTLTKPAALRDECDRIAAQGYAFDREEFIAGLVALAVPVRDGDGIARATIAVHAPTARMPLEQIARQLPALQAAAARMSRLL